MIGVSCVVRPHYSCLRSIKNLLQWQIAPSDSLSLFLFLSPWLSHFVSLQLQLSVIGWVLWGISKGGGRVFDLSCYESHEKRLLQTSKENYYFVSFGRRGFVPPKKDLFHFFMNESLGGH